MTDDQACADRRTPVPGLTACSLCTGETLGAADALDGGQLARLRGLEARGIVRLALSECLDECERGDVVVVRPGSRRSGRATRPVWFAGLAGDELTQRLADWLTAGGPGLHETPRALRDLQIRRNRGTGKRSAG